MIPKAPRPAIVSEGSLKKGARLLPMISLTSYLSVSASSRAILIVLRRHDEVGEEGAVDSQLLHAQQHHLNARRYGFKGFQRATEALSRDLQ
jgi:hypothetical protein